MKKYTLKELNTMPTIEQGHFDDLKVKTDNTKVWLSRCTVQDGEPYNNKVTVEEYNKANGYRWTIKEIYQAK